VEQPESVKLSIAADVEGLILEPKENWTKYAVVPVLVLVLMQFLAGGHQILSRVALVTGIDPLLFTFYRNLIAFAVLAPFAYYIERDMRPKMTLALFGNLNILAFFGILGNQQLYLAGLKLTSPLFAAVTQNTIPVITFLLAATIGQEEISCRKMSGLAKILGTFIGVGGAVTMTLYKGAKIYAPEAGKDELDGFVNLFKYAGIHALFDIKIDHWALGAFCLLLNCTSWGLYLINQGPVVVKYPALLSMGCLTELLGSIQVGIVGAAIKGVQFLDFRSVTLNHLIVITYAGVVVSAIVLVLQAWCVQQTGAFFVSIFIPVQTLVVAVLAILVLGETLYLGVVIGGLLIIGGFYIVTYGQKMERSKKKLLLLQCRTKSRVISFSGEDKKLSDLEEPLLS
jgi:drug/metabolite transporter (DMT)-like permease